MEKITYKEAAKLIKKSNPALFKVLQEIDVPKNGYELYYAEYDYGDKIADVRNFYYPHNKSLLSLPNLPKNIQKDFIAYDTNIPFGLTLDKCFEFSVDSAIASIPSSLYIKGDCFGHLSKLGNIKGYYYSPPVFSIHAGARSSFCVSNLGNMTLFNSIKKHLKSEVSAPKTLDQHHDFFRILYRDLVPEKKWKLKVLFFTTKWLKSILNDKKFIFFKTYLLEEYWKKVEIVRNRNAYDYVSSEILSDLKSFKPDPYTVGTIKHFMMLFTNAYPAFVTLDDDNQMPTSTIQKILLEQYNIENNPVLIGIKYFKDTNILYYPLHYALTFSYSRHYAKQQTLTDRLDSIMRLSRAFFEEYYKRKVGYATLSQHYQIAENIDMHCFHSQPFTSSVIKSIDELSNFDLKMKMSPDLGLPKTSPFLRGLIAFKKS